MNSLVNKKYVERRRSEEDRRVVFVKLTDRGVKAYRHHEDYHRQMTRAILDKLDEAEIPVLVKTLDALSEFFTGYSKNPVSYTHLQGAQKAGMGADFYENSAIAGKMFDKAGEVLQLDMKALCFEENDKLDVTEYTQAALVTTCLAMTRVAEDKGLSLIHISRRIVWR